MWSTGKILVPVSDSCSNHSIRIKNDIPHWVGKRGKMDINTNAYKYVTWATFPFYVIVCSKLPFPDARSYNVKLYIILSYIAPCTMGWQDHMVLTRYIGDLLYKLHLAAWAFDFCFVSFFFSSCYLAVPFLPRECWERHSDHFLSVVSQTLFSSSILHKWHTDPFWLYKWKVEFGVEDHVVHFLWHHVVPSFFFLFFLNVGTVHYSRLATRCNLLVSCDSTAGKDVLSYSYDVQIMFRCFVMMGFSTSSVAGHW